MNKILQSQRKTILHNITYGWNLKIIQINLYTKRKQSQTWKINSCLPKGKGKEGGINWEYGINRYKLLSIK